MAEEERKQQNFGMQMPGQRGRQSEPEEEEEPKEEILADDAEVDVEAEKKETNTDDVLRRLDEELVGLAPVKTRIREIADLLVVDRLRRRFGIESSRPTLHMSFTGSPGTGKTTVAMRMAELLKGLGYLSKGHLVNVTRDDLVGQYIGHTAPKTREVLKRAMGGVLFIDEAYYLYRRENERDYGQETIEILLQIMENERENLVVVLAGYKDKMDTFFSSNPGMGSRIAHHIDFPDYTLEELMGIAKLMLAEQQYEFSEEAEAAFRDYLERRMKQPRFANGRSVRNAIERSRLRQAARIVAESKTVSKKDLLRIEAEDILKSRVFSDEEEAPPDVDGTDRDEADVGSAAGDSPEDGAGEDRADTGEGTGEGTGEDEE
jgi:probable Rubsico expression protein CbbX